MRTGTLGLPLRALITWVVVGTLYLLLSAVANRLAPSSPRLDGRKQTALALVIVLLVVGMVEVISSLDP